MKISTEFILQYFTLANSTNSWFSTPTNLYDCLSNNSDTLIVTIGDSWTYGADLSNYERSNYVFGKQLSKLTNFDWLNLAIPAQCNHWMVTMMREVLSVEHLLDYKKIIFIITLTGVGRWFSGNFDQTFDYIKWLDNNIKTSSDFDKLIYSLNDRVVEDILNMASTNKKVQLKVGTNFIDHVGLTRLSDNQLLINPWYKELNIITNDLTYVCSSAVDTLSRVLDFLDKKKHYMFKEWHSMIIDEALTRDKLLLSSPLLTKTCHPKVDGHTIWSNYIFNNL